MSGARIFRAPGKAMILGEYVVLEGAPALVAAMDRYAEAHVAYREDSAIRVRSSLSEAAWEIRSAAGTLNAAPSTDFSLVEAILQTLGEKEIALPTSGLDLFLDSSSLSANTKLGLGSSAAIAAVATLALGGEAGSTLSTDAHIHAIADVAHRRFQNGSGSGADVAAACLGGVLQIQKGVPPKRLHGEIPHLLVVYTGFEANTRTFVRDVNAQKSDPLVRKALDEMRENAIMGAEAFAANRWRDFSTAVSKFHRAEISLTESSKVPVVTKEIADSVDIFESYGGVGKASGAGGGDIVLGFFESAQAASLAEAAVRKAGLEPVNLAIETRGVLETSGF